MTYQRRLGGAITEHNTITEAMSKTFGKISFTIDEHCRIMLWRDGSWIVRTPDGEWRNGRFRSWKEIALEEHKENCDESECTWCND